MLIVSRKPGERVMIGDQVIVLVSKVKGRKVVLGIEAPREIKVYREEVYDKINMELREIAALMTDNSVDIPETGVEEPSKYERMGLK